MKPTSLNFFLIVFCASLFCIAQERPPIEVFTPKDYQAETQNWSISQSSDKYIYVANNKGLLEYNGSSWQLYASPNQTIIRSVNVIDGLIYTGSNREFGYWKKNKFGGLDYTSLSHKLKVDFLEEEELWNIISIEDYILFQSLQRIYIYNKKEKTYNIIESETAISKMFKVNESIYFQKSKDGIYKIERGKAALKKAEHKVAPELEHIGMVTDAVFSDIDKDGDQDLLIVGEWMPIVVLQNTNGIFKNVSETYGLGKGTRGIWWSITASDLDNDGDDDYIVGNLGKNNKFKASKEHPFKVYANDFDSNGTNDVVLAKYYKNDYVPVRGRECTSQQIPYVAEKFKDYNSFASSKLLDILPANKVKGAVIYEINNFESIILINNGGKLIQQSLPVQAQISPIKASIVSDFNGDGFKDILIIGNHYGVEVETVRYDAGIGALLLGDGHNNFQYMPPTQSGFYVPADSRNINTIKQQDKSLLLVTNNNAALKIFRKNKN